MVLVDRVVGFDHSRAIETAKAVTGGEPCYQDMADDLPSERYAYPRSMVLESFGQSAALLWLGSLGGPDAAGNGLPMVGRLRNCAFTGSAFPGDVIRHRVRVERLVDDGAFMSGESLVGDQVILTVGSLIAVARPADVVTRRAAPSSAEATSLTPPQARGSGRPPHIPSPWSGRTPAAPDAS
ncbi:3-hydroxyacyl-ACP dehydratase FabZ family protein [Streptomyces sp. PKU-MA01144]|uniref:3-hydroxyacyl-ACP dehydratase FabZ family protein n=1 Tax=Streptomyces sp. PKU-MA01144 TaxID=2729138 RepID=UPI001BB1C3B5|nr:beta-hydroxyacyl-ACP dehydratase [Streptomyces sp. PKU-MA01144]